MSTNRCYINENIESCFSDVCAFYNDITKLCKRDEYNLVLHKHLGDVFYAIAAKPFFEAQYKAPLHFIVRPQQEFLMKMFGVKNYAVYDLDKLFGTSTSFDIFHTTNTGHLSASKDAFSNEVFQAIFSGIPVKKGVPFICENLINNFILYDKYWCYRWLENIGISATNKFILPGNSLDLSAKAKQKLTAIAPLEKIVLFAPEATTFSEFGPEFWNIIADKMHDKGYTIIVNSKKYKINHGICAFEFGLSLQDIVALGLKCAYIFALRSGLCDVLVGAGKRLYAFYPAQARREMHSLTRAFATNTGVNEIQIWNWKIDNVVCDDVDFTPELQKYIDGLHKDYNKESWKRIFSTRKHKHVHGVLRNLIRDLAGISRGFPENNKQNPMPFVQQNIRFLYSKKTAEFAWGVETKYTFLSGLLTFKKASSGLQRLRLFGVVIYSKKNQNGFRISRLFSIPFHKKDLKNELLRKIVEEVDHAHDDIYIVKHNIGETYIYLTHLQDWIRKNGSKNPVIIVWKPEHIPLYKMFLPRNITLQYIRLSQQDLHELFAEYVMKYNDKRVFCACPDILKNIINARKTNNSVNFYSHICNDFAIGKSDTLAKPIISQNVKDSVKNKIAIYFKRPFVIIMPDATSLQRMSTEFWNKIINKVAANGYDVFVNAHNSLNQKHNWIDFSGAVSFDCDISELYELVKHSAGVITLASGLSILLTAAGKQMDLIYTDYVMSDICVDAKQMKDIYSVYYLPNVKSEVVKEYNINLYTEEELANSIIKRYKKI